MNIKITISESLIKIWTSYGQILDRLSVKPVRYKTLDISIFLITIFSFWTSWTSKKDKKKYKNIKIKYKKSFGKMP
jgi:hypothetical protein